MLKVGHLPVGQVEPVARRRVQRRNELGFGDFTLLRQIFLP